MAILGHGINKCLLMARLGYLGSLKLKMKVKLQLRQNQNFMKMKI